MDLVMVRKLNFNVSLILQISTLRSKIENINFITPQINTSLQELYIKRCCLKVTSAKKR